VSRRPGGPSPLQRYVRRRLAVLLPTLLGMSFLVFSVASLTPGDPAEEYAQRGKDRPPTVAELAQARHELRLDRPFVVQYVAWVGHAVRGDLGKSFFTRRPVAAELRHRIVYK